MEKVSGFLLPIGVALVVLIYTSFGVLAFSTARADNSFTNRNVEYNMAYYRVEGNFEKTLSEIADRVQAEQPLELASVLQDYIEQTPTLTITKNEAKRIELLFSESVSPNVEFSGQFEIHSGGDIKVLSKGITNIEQWEEKTIEVWEGSEDGN